MNDRKFSYWKVLAAFLVLAILALGTGGAAYAQEQPWRAQYWNNTDLSGTPVLARQEAEINYVWGAGSPAPEVTPAAFSARWDRTINVSGGTYRFTATMNDGMRIWVDNSLIIDDWRSNPDRTITRDVNLSPGAHTLVVFYFQRAGNATAILTWSQISSGSGPWLARYYNNTDLSGAPALERREEEINYSWGTGSPAPEVTPAAFSARWERTINVSGGVYRFTATMNDGMRVWVDNNLIIDDWRSATERTITRDVNLGAGNHQVVVAYFNRGGTATAKLSWPKVSESSGPWRAEYFNNTSLSGSPVLVRGENGIDYNWGNGSPASGIVNSDSFSVRWTRDLGFNAGRYRFTVTVDDGVRLWVNNQLIVDRWNDQASATYNAEIDLHGGNVPVRVEYYERGGGARAHLSWTAVAAPPVTIHNWRGEYFNNTSLSGGPVVVRDDANVDFNWGLGSPAPGVIGADGFSARWTRTLDFIPGRYRFTASTDDGVRVWVNNQLVVNNWTDHVVQAVNGDIDIAGGPVQVKVEFYESRGLAQIQVSWTRLGAAGNTGGGATGVVWTYQLNVRTGPSTANSAITALPRGTTVGLIARNADASWVQVIIPDGRQGWMYAPFLTTNVAVTSLPLDTAGGGQTPAGTASVTAFRLNVRTGPGISNSIITTLPRNATVQVTHRNANTSWVRVILANGTVGWVSAAYLQSSTPFTTLPVMAG